MSKQLRKEVYKTAFELSERFPEKPSLEAGLDEEIAYTKELLQVLEEGIKSCGNKKIQKLSHEMKELLEDERLKEIRSKDDKDAGMLQCPAGELSTRVEKRTAKNGNTYLRYIFSKVTCQKCPQREKCRVGRSNAKTRSYSITQASEKNLERLKFEESEYFQERMKIRHRIEEKNGELKEAHGLRKADSRGLFAMHLQMYFTAFTAIVKRIVRLEELAME